MPYKSLKSRRTCAQTSMRSLRAYRRALAAGHPKALAAEAALDRYRNPMRAFNALRSEKDQLPPHERERLRTAPASERLSSANLQRVHESCKEAAETGGKTALAEYRRLRAEVLREMEAFA